MPLNLPPPCPNQASHTVQLINTTTDITIPAAGFVSPALPGHETLYLPTFAFLLRHSTTGSLSLFDAGARVDLHNLAPKIVPVVTAEGVHQGTTKGIHTILEEGGVRLESIERLILSHWHYDHVGDPSKFPKSMELVVGEGFKSNFMPGYPTKGDGVMLDSDFEGRNVHEIEFGDMVIGQFRAMDFLGDGSIYLLDVPGHAIGHITAMVRTTPTTFLLLGGDTCHFSGCIRPSPHQPFPETIPSSVHLSPGLPSPCPSTCFSHLHPRATTDSARNTTPFYGVTQSTGGWYLDPPTAQNSVDALVEFDEDDSILVLLAHEVALLECPVEDSFPSGTLNAWKERGWKEEWAWQWVGELPDGEGRSRKVREGETVFEKFQRGKRL